MDAPGNAEHDSMDGKRMDARLKPAGVTEEGNGMDARLEHAGATEMRKGYKV